MSKLNKFKIVELSKVSSSLRISGGQNDDDCVGTTTGGPTEDDWSDEGCCEVSVGESKITND